MSSGPCVVCKEFTGWDDQEKKCSVCYKLKGKCHICRTFFGTPENNGCCSDCANKGYHHGHSGKAKYCTDYFKEFCEKHPRFEFVDQKKIDSIKKHKPNPKMIQAIFGVMEDNNKYYVITSQQAAELYEIYKGDDYKYAHAVCGHVYDYWNIISGPFWSIGECYYNMDHNLPLYRGYTDKENDNMEKVFLTRFQYNYGFGIDASIKG